MAKYGDLLEESRETLLELTADAVTALARRRRRAKDSEDGKHAAAARAEPESGDDFLYDLLHLNLQYVNQLARLGSNYSIVAGRLLERVYDRLSQVAEAPAAKPASRARPAAHKPRRASRARRNKP